jgi:hypothetical protein
MSYIDNSSKYLKYIYIDCKEQYNMGPNNPVLKIIYLKPPGLFGPSEEIIFSEKLAAFRILIDLSTDKYKAKLSKDLYEKISNLNKCMNLDNEEIVLKNTDLNDYITIKKYLEDVYESNKYIILRYLK